MTYTLVSTRVDHNIYYAVVQKTNVLFKLIEQGNLCKFIVGEGAIKQRFWNPVGSRISTSIDHKISFKKAGFDIKCPITYYRYMYPTDGIQFITEITDPSMLETLDKMSLGNDIEGFRYLVEVILSNVKQEEDENQN